MLAPSEMEIVEAAINALETPVDAPLHKRPFIAGSKEHYDLSALLRKCRSKMDPSVLFGEVGVKVIEDVPKGWILGIFMGDKINVNDSKTLESRSNGKFGAAYLVDAIKAGEDRVRFIVDGCGVSGEHLDVSKNPHNYVKFIRSITKVAEQKHMINVRYVYEEEFNQVVVYSTRYLHAGSELLADYDGIGEDEQEHIEISIALELSKKVVTPTIPYSKSSSVSFSSKSKSAAVASISSTPSSKPKPAAAAAAAASSVPVQTKPAAAAPSVAVKTKSSVAAAAAAPLAPVKIKSSVAAAAAAASSVAVKIKSSAAAAAPSVTVKTKSSSDVVFVASSAKSVSAPKSSALIPKKKAVVLSTPTEQDNSNKRSFDQMAVSGIRIAFPNAQTFANPALSSNSATAIASDVPLLAIACNAHGVPAKVQQTGSPNAAKILQLEDKTRLIMRYFHRRAPMRRDYTPRVYTPVEPLDRDLVDEQCCIKDAQDFLVYMRCLGANPKRDVKWIRRTLDNEGGRGFEIEMKTEASARDLYLAAARNANKFKNGENLKFAAAFTQEDYDNEEKEQVEEIATPASSAVVVSSKKQKTGHRSTVSSSSSSSTPSPRHHCSTPFSFPSPPTPAPAPSSFALPSQTEVKIKVETQSNEVSVSFYSQGIGKRNLLCLHPDLPASTPKHSARVECRDPRPHICVLLCLKC